MNQSYKNLEVIIVDDHSTDSSIDIARRIKDKRVRILKTEFYGVSYARNKGIEKSTGDFISFIDSDDLWDKDKIINQVRFMISNDIAFSFTKIICI